MPPAATPPSPARTLALTVFALLAFAGNSLLCRLALEDGGTDPASFTAVRLASGAALLWALLRLRGGGSRPAGDWVSALALFVYAAGFSWAYTGLPAGTGALLLFGAVQATLLLAGLAAGTRWTRAQALGLSIALGGLVVLLRPGLDAPPALPAGLMLAAGVAWGAYTLRGRGVADATAATAGNFLRAAPLGLLACLASLPWLRVDALGLACALASGALASGLGYAVWYTALRGLSPQAAGSSQLAVPVITALAGVWLLGENLGPRLLVGAAAVLAGIALTLRRRAPAPAA